MTMGDNTITTSCMILLCLALNMRKHNSGQDWKYMLDTTEQHGIELSCVPDFVYCLFCTTISLFCLFVLFLNVIMSSAFLWLLSLNVIMSSAFLWLLSLNVIMSSAFLWLLITRLISSHLSCNSVLILIHWVHLWTAMVNNSTNINKRAWTQTTTYAIVNCSPGLRQEHKCGGDKPVNGTPTLPSWELYLQRQCLYKQCHWFWYVLFGWFCSPTAIHI
jgi:hypothetical protein